MTTIWATIDTNARINSQEHTSRPDHLTYTVKNMQDTTHVLTRNVIKTQERATEFQQTTLTRITTTMVEFGQLANNTEQMLDAVNLQNKYDSTLYIISS